jgi:hypothetical protein
VNDIKKHLAELELGEIRPVALLDEARPAARPTGSGSSPWAALFAPLICTDDFPAPPPFSLICVMPSDEAVLSL